MKRWLKWLLVALIVAGIALGVLRSLKTRKAQQTAVAEASAAKTQTQVELAESDIVKAAQRELGVGVPLTGALKAANFAVIKARVAGELQGMTVREGDNVKAGQVLARIETVEYEARVNQTKRQADAAKAQIDIAQRQYDNNKALVDQGFISKTALDTSLATLESAQASYKAAQASVDVSRKSLDDTVLRSPLTGTVSQRLSQPGERVGIDARILEIVDLSRLELEASISAADAVAVRVGQTAQLQIEGMASTGRQTKVSARVARINPSTQAGSRSVLVYLSVDKPEGLRQGLYAEGKLGTGRASGLTVPVSAVRTDKPSPYVQVVSNSQVQHKPVTLGVRGEASGQNDLFVVVEGIADGDAVLGGSVGPLREGTAIKLTSQK